LISGIPEDRTQEEVCVISTFAVVFLAAVIATFSATPIYQATAKVIIEKSESKAVTAINPILFSRRS